MANGDKQLSGQDITELMQARAQLPDDDPRGAQFDDFIKEQLKNYVPSTKAAKGQAAPIPAGLQPTERAMQFTGGMGNPQFVDMPKGQGQAYQQATQQGQATGEAIGSLIPALPSIVQNPVGTAAGLVTAHLAGKGAELGGRKLAEQFNASPETQQDVGDLFKAGGNLAGMLLGIKGAGALQETFGAKALKAQAQATYGELEKLVGNAPVNTNHFADTAAELRLQGQRSATLPLPIKQWLNRVAQTQTGGKPMTYEELQDFQSNIKALLKNPVGEQGARIKSPNIYRLAGKAVDQMGNALEEATQTGLGQGGSSLPGFGTPQIAPNTHAGANQQYALAAARTDRGEFMKEWALKMAKLGGAGLVGGGAWDFGKDLKQAIFGK